MSVLVCSHPSPGAGRGRRGAWQSSTLGVHTSLSLKLHVWLSITVFTYLLFVCGCVSQA